MTTTFFSVAAKKFNAKMNEKPVSIHYINYQCIRRILNEEMDKVEFGKESKLINKIDKIKATYASPAFNPQYIIVRDCSPDEAANREYVTVFKINDQFDGLSDDNWLEGLDEVGILLKSGRNWIVETDLVKVELLRRGFELAEIASGLLHIGFEKTPSMEGMSKVDQYKLHLATRDAKHGAIYTRGYGFY